MKRWMLILLAVLFVVVLGGAGYLGLQSVQGTGTADAPKPSTVKVSRGVVQTTVTAPGHLEHAHEATLAMEVTGTLTDVQVQPGQKVEAGAYLAQLDLAPLQHRLKDSQVELAIARAALEQLQANPSPAERAAAELALARAEARWQEVSAGPTAAALAAAEAEVALARGELDSLTLLPAGHVLAEAQARHDRAAATLQQAQAAYDLVKDRPDIGMLPQALALHQATIDYQLAKAGLTAAGQGAAPAALEAARARLAAAEANLAQVRAGPSLAARRVAELERAQAEAELERVASGPSAAELELAVSTVHKAERAVEQARADLECATLTAPFEGTIVEVRAGAGQKVVAGSSLMRLVDSTALEVVSTVVEEDIPRIQVGQEVDLFFDAEPETLVKGRVARIVPERLPGDRPLYPVYITCDEQPASLLAGMTADASIVVEARQDALRLPRALVPTRSDGNAVVQVWTGGSVEDRLVQTGLRGDAFVEIVEGLAEGEEVVSQ